LNCGLVTANARVTNDNKVVDKIKMKTNLKQYESNLFDSNAVNN
jgi:hypothetical protein